MEPRFGYGSRHHADPVPGAPALALQALTVRYPTAPEPALREVTLSIERGQRVALVGPNGAGKSTLLKAVAGLLTPMSGRVRIYGNPVGACHHRVAYLPQRGEIAWDFPITLHRLVMTGRYAHLGWLRRPGAADRALVDVTLAALRLNDLADRQISELSGGQQQRALLARALVQESDLLLLDEPLNAVDVETQAVVRAAKADLRAAGKTLVVATHDWARLEEDFDVVLRLEGGRVLPVRERELACVG